MPSSSAVRGTPGYTARSFPSSIVGATGIIGDLHTVALVGLNGAIDFLCFPRFDPPSVFAALLDDEKGGRFQIEPHLGHRTTKQLYLPNTNVLLTRFLSDSGVAERPSRMEALLGSAEASPSPR